MYIYLAWISQKYKGHSVERQRENVLELANNENLTEYKSMIIMINKIIICTRYVIF